MIEAAVRLRDAIWGVPLILLLVGTGLYLTILLRGLQLQRLATGLRIAFVQRDEPDADGDISHFQALMTSLAATVGTGNIVGVATALTAGGPGALLWMWVAGFFAMAIRYAEAVLGVRFRETDVRGEKSGGPMYYLANGIRWGSAGRGLAFIFAALAALAALGIGNGVQAHAVASAVSNVSGAPPLLVGAVTATLAGAVILGGIRSIARFAGVFVPLMIVVYLAAACWLLWRNAALLPDVFRAIFEGAFGARAVGGGAAGFTIMQTMRSGLARGVYSNQAGLGTGAIIAAAARTREPVRQALVAMTQTFIDTLVVCTITGLVLLTSGHVGGPADGAELAQAAFSSGFPGEIGAWAVAVALAVFAFTTILGWAYVGERCMQYVAGERAVLPYRLVFVGIIPLGSVLQLQVVWTVSDILNGLMALPNLVGLFLLSGIVVRETRAYFARDSAGRDTDQPSNRR
ncbi:MAG: alanine/glycine:cation symporter family protein [Gemmatimonadota bacterium]|jgi:AGCS family alanine or glycine:cation symporter